FCVSALFCHTQQYVSLNAAYLTFFPSATLFRSRSSSRRRSSAPSWPASCSPRSSAERTARGPPGGPPGGGDLSRRRPPTAVRSRDRKSTSMNYSHVSITDCVFSLEQQILQTNVN